MGLLIELDSWRGLGKQELFEPRLLRCGIS